MRVGKIIITMVLILHILSSLGTDGSFKEGNIENSALSVAGRTLTPLLKPMGIDQENWPATVAVFTGVLHKVVIISTLKKVYAASNHTGQETEKTFGFWKAIKQSFMTIPKGINKMLGINTGTKKDLSKSSFFTALHNNFHGQIGAYAYLLFVLLYFPCIATTSTAYKESNSGWAAFMVVWATGIAYLAATLLYQVATFNQHPGTTVTWVVISIFVLVLVIFGFRYWGGRDRSSAQ
jgi:ferrous iron transport protein B